MGIDPRHTPGPRLLKRNEKDVWACKIGFTDGNTLPSAADVPMRVAVEEAFFKLTGRYPDFIFSGWGETLTEGELAVLENHLPSGVQKT